MNILFIAPRFHTNQFFTSKHLLKKNNVYYLCQYKGPIENYKFIKPTICKGFFFPLNFNFKNFDNTKAAFLPDIYFLKKFLKRISPDIVILRHQSKIFSYICLFFLKLYKIKTIIYDQNELTLKVNKKFFNKIWFKFEFFFRTYILNLPWISPINNHKNKKKLKNCFYLPFAVEKRIKKKKKININKINLLTIGKFQKRKNLLMLCKIINKIKNNYKIKLNIVGQVKYEHERKYFNLIKNYILKNKLGQYIQINKNISHNSINRFYSESDIFILPSTNEAAAISVLEAAAHGLPVIISNTSGTRGYFKNNYNAKYFDDNNFEDLKKKIEFFLKNINNIKKYSSNLSKNFDKTMSIDNYEKYFEKLLKKI